MGDDGWKRDGDERNYMRKPRPLEEALTQKEKEMDEVIERTLGPGTATPEARVAVECILATVAVMTYERLSITIFPPGQRKLVNSLTQLVGPALAHAVMALVGGEEKATKLFEAVDAWQSEYFHGK